MNAAALEQIWVETPEIPESIIQYFPEETFSETETEKQVPYEGECEAACGRERDPSNVDK